jgi:hypothetical protein
VFRHDTFTPIFTPMKVTIELHQDKLRLRWNCPETGRRRNLHLGLEDSDTARGVAAVKKDASETDIKYGYYDRSLVQ